MSCRSPGRERIAFHTVEADGGLRVLPSDAVPYISTGVLDVDLFDVDELIRDGYGDAAAQQLPLIVKYAGGLRSASTLAGTTTTRPLESIGASAVTAAKDQLPTLWKSLSGAHALSGGVSKVWLDGKVRPVLDKSVPQIGAPDAWKAGYQGSGVQVAVLDTGVDAQHLTWPARSRKRRTSPVARPGRSTISGTGRTSQQRSPVPVRAPVAPARAWRHRRIC
jgi:hypothetical protein